jgi:hypothetical protein
MPDAPVPEPATGTSHPIQPPPPPWGSSTTPQTASPPATAPPQKPVDLRVDMPAKPDFGNSNPSANSVVTPGSASSVTGSAIAQSPVNLVPTPSPFSPAVTSAVTPGPARKKLSLSDYTSRRAKMAQQSSNASTTPSLAQSQSITSPTMTNSSLPNQTSPSSKSSEPALPPVAEEMKPDVPNNTTSTSTST